MDNFWMVGKVQKPHGVKGALIIEWTAEASGIMDASEFAYVELEGDPVPFFFSSKEPWGDSSFLVSFEDIVSREKAKELAGHTLFMKKDLLSQEDSKTLQESVNGFKDIYGGYSIIDNNSGMAYPIISIEDYPHQKIACVMSSGEEKLIPMSDSYIISQDSEKREIVMDLPEGLL